MAETTSTRITRLADAMTEMAKAQMRMDNALAHLAEVQATETQRTEERFREIKAESLALEKRTDERIANLVRAIGELLRRNGKRT